MEMTEGVYRKVDPDGGSSSLSVVKSVEADEVLNRTSNSTENVGDPNHRDSAGREQQSGMEMTERVYRKVDPDGGSSSLSVVKSVEADEVLIKTPNSRENAADPNYRHSGWRSVAVCLGLLCTLLLCGIAVLSVQMIMMSKQSEQSYREKLQMQADYDNMTSDYQQLQMSYNNLNSVKAQLQDTNNNLTRENLQLQTRYASLSKEKEYLQRNNNAIVKDKDRLQARYNTLSWEKSQLETTNNNLTLEKSKLQERYDNLTNDNTKLQEYYRIMNSTKMQLQDEYDHLERENSQLQSTYSNLNSEKSTLQTRYNAMNSEKSKLQTQCNNLVSEKSNLQTRYNNLVSEKSNLQGRHDNLKTEKIELQNTYRNISVEQTKLQDRLKKLTAAKSILQDNYNSLNSEKVQLMDRYNNVSREKSQLQERCDAITAEKDTMQRCCALTNGINIQYAVDVTLDPDTAYNYLILSADGKQVKYGDTSQNRPDNPKRFDSYYSVLGKQGFNSGKFYYEVQVSGKTGWDLGVARESISRKGSITRSPTNGFWTMVLNNSQYKAQAGPDVTLSLKDKPERVGVFVDYGAGFVSFYDADRWSLIYSFKDVSFREKIYPIFNPHINDNGKNSAPLVITPVSRFKYLNQ